MEQVKYVTVLLAFAALPPLWAGCWPEGGAGSPEALIACVDRDRYVADLERVAGERDNGSSHWQEVQDLCAGRLEELGFEVERERYGTGVNVIGVKRGGGQAGQEVLISAHYDHIEGCEGADDNATGVAAVLEAGRVLAPAGFARTLVLALWDEEEDGMIGSDAYASRAKDRGEDIAVAYVLDMIGYGSSEPGSQKMPEGLDLLFKKEAAWLKDREYRGDFIVATPDTPARPYADDMALYADHVGLPALVLEIKTDWKMSPLLEDLRRSDHAGFWARDYPAVAITDSAEFRNPYYHCREGQDSVETLDHGFAVQVLKATIGSVAKALEIE